MRRESPDANTGTQWRGKHLAFDCGGEIIAFGSDIDDVIAGETTDTITNIAIKNAPELVEVTGSDHKVKEATIELASGEHDTLITTEITDFYSLSTRALIIVNLIPLLGMFFPVEVLAMAFSTPLLALVLPIGLQIIVDVKVYPGEHNRHLKTAS